MPANCVPACEDPQKYMDRLHIANEVLDLAIERTAALFRVFNGSPEEATKMEQPMCLAEEINQVLIKARMLNNVLDNMQSLF